MKSSISFVKLEFGAKPKMLIDEVKEKNSVKHTNGMVVCINHDPI